MTAADPRLAEDTAYHYRMIARALAEIDAGGPGLTLDALADRMGMSTAHFQRVFSHWVGVSPKRYQQYLTLDHAKRLLADRHSVLETSLATGLSGGGRLHDLFLRWEAMTPGEYARAGAGLTILWGWFESPFGPALVMGTERGICGMGFAAEQPEAQVMQDLRSRWPKAEFVENPAALRPWVQAALGAGEGAAPLYLIGAPFQIKVWEALLSIPSGHVTTYSDIARVIGHPA
ncbi:MAG: helix-turn-helix domain-containing protein, partial [Gemmobacter sp.]